MNFEVFAGCFMVQFSRPYLNFVWFAAVNAHGSHLVGPSVSLFDENQSQTGFISEKSKH